MRIGSESNSIVKLYAEIKMLEPLFNKTMLVNPIEKEEILVHEYALEDSKKSCTESCPISKDACGCICKDAMSNGQNRCRFVYNKTEAFFVIAKPIQLTYRAYLFVMIMKLDPSFSFGALSDSEAIDNITKVSSHLVIDPLTKIFNRKYLMDNIDFLMNKASKERKELCLACIDIDNFKRFNDTYGHDFGDKVLCKVAETMTKAIESMDEAYPIRIGGDEFVIVALGINKSRFKAAMNKLCIMIDDAKLPYENQMVGIRISIGVSEMMSDRIESYKQLYDKADGQLYEAKEAGKGCVR